MMQADAGHSAPAQAPATGIANDISRRGLLAGAVLAAGAVALPAAAATAEPEMLAYHDPRQGPDARFWVLHDRWTAALDAWDADPDVSDESMNRWGDTINAIEADMMLTPVSTAAAVHAKYMVDKGGLEIVYERGGMEFTTGQLIGWDLERLVKKELWA